MVFFANTFNWQLDGVTSRAIFVQGINQKDGLEARKRQQSTHLNINMSHREDVTNWHGSFWCPTSKVAAVYSKHMEKNVNADNRQRTKACWEKKVHPHIFPTRYNFFFNSALWDWTPYWYWYCLQMKVLNRQVCFPLFPYFGECAFARVAAAASPTMGLVNRLDNNIFWLVVLCFLFFFFNFGPGKTALDGKWRRWRVTSRGTFY